MKVSHYTGTLSLNDASGHAVMAMHEAFRARGDDSLIYCDRRKLPNRPDVRVVDGIRAALREWKRLRGADLHLFHFGASYDLFTVLPWLPRHGRRVVYFHGVMPRTMANPEDMHWVNHSHRRFRLANRADLILHATDYSKELARSMGVTRPKYARLPLSIDLPDVPRPPRVPGEPFRMIHVGRLVAGKGLLEILRALQSLRAGGFSDWELEVVHNPQSADSGYETKVRAFLADNGLERQVRFTGPPGSRLDLAHRYTGADLTVLGTRHETYCLPLLESLRCGTPVVAFAAGAVPEVAGGHALLVEPGDIAAFASAILRARTAWPSLPSDLHGNLEPTEFRQSCAELLRDKSPDLFAGNLMACLA